MFQQGGVLHSSSCFLIAIAVGTLQNVPGTSARTLTVTTAPEAIAHWVADELKKESLRAASAPGATVVDIAGAAAHLANKLAAPGPSPAPAPVPAPAPAAASTAPAPKLAAPGPSPGPAPERSAAPGPSPTSRPSPQPSPAPAPSPAPFLSPAPAPACRRYAPGPGPSPGPCMPLPQAPADFVVPTLRPDHGLSIPEMVQMAVESAVDAAARKAVLIAKDAAHNVGLSAGQRLGNVLARTAAEAATKATSHELILKACRVAAVDGMDAVQTAAKHLGLTEDAVMVARQEIAVGGFQRKCERRVKSLTPVEWAEHHALHDAEVKTKTFINTEGSRRAALAGEKAALNAVSQTADSLKVRLGRLAAWETHEQLMHKDTQDVARRAIRQMAEASTLKVAVQTAKEYPKVMFQKELMNITKHVGPQLLALLDKVAMRAVEETVEETALKTVIPATQRLAEQVTQSGVQRQIFNQAMEAAAMQAHSKALAAANAAAFAVARDEADPQAFDMLSHAGLGSAGIA